MSEEDGRLFEIGETVILWGFRAFSVNLTDFDDETLFGLKEAMDDNEDVI